MAESNTSQTRRPFRRLQGRTLLLRGESPVDTSTFHGLVNTHTTEHSTFLTFTSLSASRLAYQVLRTAYQEAGNTRGVKYCTYDVFYRFSGDFDRTNTVFARHQLENQLRCTLEGVCPTVNVLSLRLYNDREEPEHLTGTGVLTVDTKTDLDTLVTMRDVPVVGTSDTTVSLYHRRRREASSDAPTEFVPTD